MSAGRECASVLQPAGEEGREGSVDQDECGLVRVVGLQDISRGLQGRPGGLGSAGDDVPHTSCVVQPCLEDGVVNVLAGAGQQVQRPLVESRHRRSVRRCLVSVSSNRPVRGERRGPLEGQRGRRIAAGALAIGRDRGESCSDILVGNPRGFRQVPGPTDGCFARGGRAAQGGGNGAVHLPLARRGEPGRGGGRQQRVRKRDSGCLEAHQAHRLQAGHRGLGEAEICCRRKYWGCLTAVGEGE